MAAPIAVNAAPVSFGALSSDDSGSTEIIADSLNNLEWLRWDVLADLTYAQTLAAISAGGAYEGWQLAHNAEAQMFTNALLDGQVNRCSVTSEVYQTCAAGSDDGGPIVNFTRLLGDSYGNTGDIAWFLSDNGIGQEVGYINIDSINGVRKLNEWGTIAETDDFSSSGSLPNLAVGWLLYRSATVPEPGTLALFGLGLAGLGMKRRRRVA